MAAHWGELKDALVADTLRVGEERPVHHEACLSGAVGEDVLLDIVNSLELVAALGPDASKRRGVLARGGAGGGSRSSGNMGEATISQKTRSCDELPSLVQLAATAALVDEVA